MYSYEPPKYTFDTTSILSKDEVIGVLAQQSQACGITIGLFGSYSRNQQRPDSDIDLLLFEDGLKLRGNCNLDGYRFWKNLEFILRKPVSINYWNNLREEVYVSMKKDLILIQKGV